MFGKTNTAKYYDKKLIKWKIKEEICVLHVWKSSNVYKRPHTSIYINIYIPHHTIHWNVFFNFYSDTNSKKLSVRLRALDTSKKLFYYNVSENRNNGRKESNRMEDDRWKIFAHRPSGPYQDFKSFS